MIAAHESNAPPPGACVSRRYATDLWSRSQGDGKVSRVSDLLNLGAGATFRRVDLHVHTPGSADIHESWRDATPQDVISQALAQAMEVIAVTDHNSIDWCQAVLDAAASAPLKVLPGVEISTRDGHLLAIFDADKSLDRIRELLIRSGIGSAVRRLERHRKRRDGSHS